MTTLTKEQKLAQIMVITTMTCAQLTDTTSQAQTKGLRYQIPNKDIAGLQLVEDAGAVLATVYLYLRTMTLTDADIKELTLTKINALREEYPELFVKAESSE